MSIQIYSRVIIQSMPDAFLVTCGRCSGTGENNQEYECRVCKGTGKVLLKVPRNLVGEQLGLIKCGRCDGSGENNSEHFCRVCHGVGAMIKRVPRFECSRCNGTGENSESYFCSTCDACGSVWIGDVPSY